MIRLKIILVSLLVSLVASAATSAEDLLGACAAKIEKSPSLVFEAQIRSGANSQAATLTMSKEKYHLDTPTMQVWYDGRTMWVFNQANSEVSISLPTADELTECNPLAMLVGYQKHFTASMVKGRSDMVQLTARDKMQTVQKAVVTIDPRTSLPTALTATMANGAVLTLSVRSASVGKIPQKGAFAYDSKRFPAAEVIDLR